MESSILTLLIFIPVAGAALMLPFAKLYGKENVHYYKWIAAITTGIQLALAWILYKNFNPALSIAESPFTVQIDWIKHFNIQYFLGVDGFGKITQYFGNNLKLTQNGVVQNYLLGGMLGVLLLIVLIQQF